MNANRPEIGADRRQIAPRRPPTVDTQSGRGRCALHRGGPRACAPPAYGCCHPAQPAQPFSQGLCTASSPPENPGYSPCRCRSQAAVILNASIGTEGLGWQIPHDHQHSRSDAGRNLRLPGSPRPAGRLAASARARLVPLVFTTALRIDLCPMACGDGGGCAAVRRGGRSRLAAGIEDGVVGFVDAVGEVVQTQDLPDVLDRVEFRRLGRHGSRLMFWRDAKLAAGWCQPAPSG